LGEYQTWSWPVSIINVLGGLDIEKTDVAWRLTLSPICTIMQNFVGTLVVDSIGVGLAAFGFLNPLWPLSSTFPRK
jgi:hypothetical protein